jgi:creatinine amidohydrolase
MREWKLQEVTYKLVRERQYEVAVLPIGATEPHGLHLPYGTDNYEAEGIADRVCAAAHNLGAKVMLLPTLPYGCDSNMMEFPLAMDVKQSTLNLLVTDIVRALERHGVHKFILFNGHGGNDFKPLLRDLHGRTRVFLVLVDWWRVGDDVAREIFTHGGDHANEMETSCMLELQPHLVHLADAGDGGVNLTRFEALNKGWATITRPWHLLTKDSTVGDPRQATREKGKQFIEVIVERLARFIKELSDAAMDERFPY